MAGQVPRLVLPGLMGSTGGMTGASGLRLMVARGGKGKWWLKLLAGCSTAQVPLLASGVSMARGVRGRGAGTEDAAPEACRNSTPATQPLVMAKSMRAVQADAAGRGILRARTDCAGAAHGAGVGAWGVAGWVEAAWPWPICCGIILLATVWSRLGRHGLGMLWARSAGAGAGAAGMAVRPEAACSWKLMRPSRQLRNVGCS